MSEDKDDRQYDPSEQKLRKARDKGDIPRSAEVPTAISYLSFRIMLPVAGAIILPAWLSMGARLLGAEPWPDQRGTWDVAQAVGGWTAGWVLAMLAVPAVLVIVASTAQRTLLFTPSKIAPDLKKINPMKNAGQKFGKTGLIGFSMSLLKVGFVVAAGVFMFGGLVRRILASGSTDETWLPAIGDILVQLLTLGLAMSVLFAGVDLFWRHYDFRQRNRMTRREMEDEHKESEGDPHLKHARRQRAVDIALGSMLADVEKADVVIVNPTHYAVALEWKRGSGRAPVCVAKGVDEVAARIRDRARKHYVPIWSDPPCARAIHATVKIGDEIARDQFGPVAAAIRFAEAMRVRVRKGWAISDGRAPGAG